MEPTFTDICLALANLLTLTAFYFERKRCNLSTLCHEFHQAKDRQKEKPEEVPEPSTPCPRDWRSGLKDRLSEDA